MVNVITVQGVVLYELTSGVIPSGTYIDIIMNILFQPIGQCLFHYNKVQAPKTITFYKFLTAIRNSFFYDDDPHAL